MYFLVFGQFYFPITFSCSVQGPYFGVLTIFEEPPSVKWEGFEARIDKHIAPLIKVLWKAELFTFNSCE